VNKVKESLFSNYKQQCKGWLSLLRIPNLLTLPGDVILGFIIAESSLEDSNLILGFSFSKITFLSYSIFYVILAVLSVYCFGLITNDLADFNEDLKKRSDRPLPSGIISKQSAWGVAILFAVSGLIFASFANQRVFLAVVALIGLVVGYNYLFKKSWVSGPFILGLCRSLAVMIGFWGSGINLGYYPLMFHIVCLTWFLYFFAVSLVAYYETEKRSSSGGGSYIFLLIPLLWGITAPFGSDALGVIFMIGEVPPGIFLGFGAFTVFFLFVVKNFITLNLKRLSPLTVQKSVGELIRSIIFLQVSGCAFLGYPYIALTLLSLWFPARFLARIFYSS